MKSELIMIPGQFFLMEENGGVNLKGLVGNVISFILQVEKRFGLVPSDLMCNGHKLSCNVKIILHT